jgi:restriction system protein
MLAANPDGMRDLSPDVFENLVGNRIEKMGFEIVRVGTSIYQKDGGIDMVAWPRASPIPFLMAVQAKHTSQINRRIGPTPVRELLGTVQAHGFNAGLLVTNTTFTPDAKWFAEQRAILLRLHDIDDLQRWLKDEYLREAEWRGIPAEIEVCPGVSIKLPR